MAINLAIKYLPYVDEIMTKESKREKVTNKDYDFVGGHTVKIYKIGTATMNNYGRTGSGNNYGTPEHLDATTEEQTLAKDRSFSFIIDELDADETVGALKAAECLQRQVREVVIPEVDAHVFAKMAAGAGTKKTDEALSASNIYDAIIKGSSVLDDESAPDEGRSIIVIPEVLEMMKKNPDININSDVTAEQRKNGVIAMVDGNEVIKVTKATMPEGFGFMIAHSLATVAPVKLESYQTYYCPPGISGWLVEGRIVYDAFVLENKAKAIYYHSLAAAEAAK